MEKNEESKDIEVEFDIAPAQKAGESETVFHWTLVFFSSVRMNRFKEAFTESMEFVMGSATIDLYYGTVFCEPIRIYLVLPDYSTDYLEDLRNQEDAVPIYIAPDSDKLLDILIRTGEDTDEGIEPKQVHTADTGHSLFECMCYTKWPPMTMVLFTEICTTSGIFQEIVDDDMPLDPIISTSGSFGTLSRPISLSEAYAGRSLPRVYNRRRMRTRASSPEQSDEEGLVEAASANRLRTWYQHISDRAYGAFEFGGPFHSSQSTRTITSIPTTGPWFSGGEAGTVHRSSHRRAKKRRLQPTERELEEFIKLRRVQHDHEKKAKANTEEPKDISAEMMTCKICMLSKINSVLVPCGHACACSDCCIKLETKTNAEDLRCPICREPVIFSLPFHL